MFFPSMDIYLPGDMVPHGTSGLAHVDEWLVVWLEEYKSDTLIASKLKPQCWRMPNKASIEGDPG